MYIYIFDTETPTTPRITGNTGTAGNQFTLTCSGSVSQSLPVVFRNLSIIEYTWSGDYSGIGSSITIGSLYRDDHMKTVRCEAHDQGSTGLRASRDAYITVYCKYD